jgi:hypothetical protein
LIDRAGRRWLTVSLFLILGLSCVIIAFIPKEHTTIILVIFLIGRTAGAAAIQVKKMFLCWLLKTKSLFSYWFEI